MEHKLDQQNDISLAPEKMSPTSNTLENSSTDQHSAIKSKILNAIDKIRKNKKRADLNAITDHILRTEASNLDQDFIEMMITELTTEIKSRAEGLHKALTPFRGPCLSHQNKKKSFVVLYIKNAIIFSPSSWK